MNKKGMSLGFQIVLVVLFLLIVFGVVSGAFGLSFSKVKGFWVEIYDSMSSQIDDLKESLGLMGEEEAAAKMKEVGKKIVEEGEKLPETDEMHKLLTDAANSLKERDYDGALDNYIKYYVECEKDYTPPNLPKEYETTVLTGKWTKPTCHTVTKYGAKLRILNVLRERAFVSKKVPKYEELANVKFIKEEYNAAAVLMKAAIELKNNNLEDAITYLKNYEDIYYLKSNEDEYNLNYYTILSGYYNAKNAKSSDVKYPYCDNLLDSVVQIKALTNRYFFAFEMYKGKNLLTALDYKFLMVPHDEIKKLCEGQVTIKPEEPVLDTPCKIDNIVFEVEDGKYHRNLYFQFLGEWYWSYDKSLTPKKVHPTNIVKGLTDTNKKLIMELNKISTEELEGLKLLFKIVDSGEEGFFGMPSLVAFNPYKRSGNGVEYKHLPRINYHFVVRSETGAEYYKFASNDEWSYRKKGNFQTQFSPIGGGHYLYQTDKDKGTCLIFSETLK